MALSPANTSLFSTAELQRTDTRRSPFTPGQSASFGDALDVELSPQMRTVSGRARASETAAGVPPPSNSSVALLERDPSFRARGGGQDAGLAGPGNPPNANGSGFEPSTSPLAPHLIRYKSVPDAVKFPNGPYRQAPEEHGGEWWLVNPFTGSEPWLRPSQIEGAIQAADVLPEGFAEVFGPRPTRKEVPDYFEFRLAKIEWEQDLNSFKQMGIPEGFDEAQLASAAQTFEEWGLGRPIYYEDRSGWHVRFLEGAIPGFEMNANTAVQAPHLVIAKYQIRLIQRGVTPENTHPWIPPHLLTPAAEAAVTA